MFWRSLFALDDHLLEEIKKMFDFYEIGAVLFWKPWMFLWYFQLSLFPKRETESFKHI